MYPATYPLFGFDRTPVDMAFGLASIGLDAAERLVGLQIGAARDVMEDGIGHARALSEARTMDDWLALQSAATIARIARVLTITRLCSDVAARAQGRLGALLGTALPGPAERPPAVGPAAAAGEVSPRPARGRNGGRRTSRSAAAARRGAGAPVARSRPPARLHAAGHTEGGVAPARRPGAARASGRGGARLPARTAAPAIVSRPSGTVFRARIASGRNRPQP